MNSVAWYFRLEGNDLDILALEQLFRERATFTTRDDGLRYILMDLPFPASEVHAALAAAEELLLKLNGIARVIHGNHENVRIGGVFCQETPDSPRTQFIFPSSVQMRARVGIPTVVVTGSTSSPAPVHTLIGDRLLNAADRDGHF